MVEKKLGGDGGRRRGSLSERGRREHADKELERPRAAHKKRVEKGEGVRENRKYGRKRERTRRKGELQNDVFAMKRVD